jgi:MFS family permease
MIGAQFASRLIYPRLGPRRHITFGLIALAAFMLVLSQVGLTTNLWLIRGVMFFLGLSVAQIFVPSQAAAFAKISPEATGRASTLFNTGRQVGSAIGVAILSTVLIGIGTTHSVAGIVHPNLRAYHFAFAVAAVFALAATALSLAIHDNEAAETMVRRSHHPGRNDSVRLSVSESGT